MPQNISTNFTSHSAFNWGSNFQRIKYKMIIKVTCGAQQNIFKIRSQQNHRDQNDSFKCPISLQIPPFHCNAFQTHLSYVHTTNLILNGQSERICNHNDKMISTSLLIALNMQYQGNTSIKNI